MMTMVAIDWNTVHNMDHIQLLDLLVTCKTMWNIFMVHMSSSSIIFDFVLEVDQREQIGICRLALRQIPPSALDCIRAPPRRGRYWEIHPRRPKDFPRPERFPEGEARGKSRGLSTDTILKTCYH